MSGSYQEGGNNEPGTLFEVIGPAFGATLLESLLYGIHCVLFSVSVYLLWPRHASMRIAILAATTAMFALSSADLAMTWKFVIVDVPNMITLRISPDVALLSLTAKNWLFVANNFLADLILLYRCYILWGRSRLVTALPLALLLADTVWGFLSQSKSNPYWTETRFTPVFLWSVFAFNILLTTLTAGRIFYIGRAYTGLLKVERPLGMTKPLCVIIESGALYSLSILLVVTIPASHLKVHLYLLLLMGRLVGIMPVLLIVQVELMSLRQRYSKSNDTTEVFTTTHPTSAAYPGILTSQGDIP